MGKKYVGKSPKSLKEIFYKKQNMKLLIYEEMRGPPERVGGPAHPNVIDFHESELVLFGKVNKFFLPIVPSKSFLKSIKPSYTKDENKDTQAIDFVVDQFEAMAQQFQKCAMKGSISSADPYLSNIKIYRAYQDPYALYDQYLALLTASLKGILRSRNIQIGNFDEFMTILLTMLKKSALDFPLTLPGYVKSKHYSATNSGLVLEIADLDYNDDNQKVEQFYQSLNWKFWLNTCDAYGFTVDGNAPWRIRADLESVAMRKAALLYGSSGAQGVLINKFKSAAHIYVLQQFIPSLLKIYNQLRAPKIIQPQVCKNNTVQISVKDGISYDLETLQDSYPIEYFTKKYFEIRLLEEESQFTETQKNTLMRESLQYIKVNGAYYALLYFETILNKPFDYRGSVSYNIKGRKAFDAEKKSPEEIKAEMREIQRETTRIRQKKGLSQD
jgi:hypothetical protein